jgi:hypothetical protein
VGHGTSGSSGVSGVSCSGGTNPYPHFSSPQCNVSFIGGFATSSFYSSSTGGYQNSQNVASSFRNFIGGGCRNGISGNSSAILGGHCNCIISCVEYNAIAGGRCNTIIGSYNNIGGGANSNQYGSFSYITGGYYITNFGTRAGVVNYNLSSSAFYASDTAYFYFLSKAAGSFKIDHPDPTKSDTMELWHSFVESPNAGDNLYRYKVTTQNGTATLQLPDYYKFLNENSQLKIAPANNFGKAYGVIDPTESFVTINSTVDGDYNVLLIGTRKDADAKFGWSGVERAKPECSSYFGI